MTIEEEIQTAYKTIQFPRARALADLFVDVRYHIVPNTNTHPLPPAFVYTRGLQCLCAACELDTTCELSTYCGVSGVAKAREALSVYPTTEVIETIGDKATLLRGARMYFNLYYREPEPDGRRSVLLTCDHTVQSGGLWLAILPGEAVNATLKTLRPSFLADREDTL